MRGYLVALFLCGACTDGGTARTGDSADDTGGAYLPACTAGDGDPYDYGGLDTAGPAAAIAGDTLSVVVGYGGGCEDHAFTLCWPDQSFEDTSPPATALDLAHDAHGDTCDLYLTDTLDFDLGPLREAWIAAGGEASGEITVRIAGEELAWSL